MNDCMRARFTSNEHKKRQRCARTFTEVIKDQRNSVTFIVVQRSACPGHHMHVTQILYCKSCGISRDSIVYEMNRGKMKMYLF